jgi:large subunit ribosomal protein L14
MIQAQTKLKIADNSGAKVIQCVKVLGGSRRRYAQLGDVIVGVVKEAEPRKIVKKHEIIRAVIVRQKKPYRREDGSYISFDENAAVVLDKEKNIKGGRIIGPIPRELKIKGYKQIVALAEEVL